jgi:hypothetical protein
MMVLFLALSSRKLYREREFDYDQTKKCITSYNLITGSTKNEKSKIYGQIL